MRAQFWLKVNTENVITRLGPVGTCTGCCARSISYNTVTSVTNTNHYLSRKMKIKSFGISIFKQIKLYSTGDQT